MPIVRVAAALLVPLLAAAVVSRRRPAPHRLFRWAGRVVAITGGSRGLGLVLARELAARNARVALIARDEAELARARAAVPDGRVLTVPCDVRDPRQAQAAVDHIVAEWGRLDVLINNAGVIVSAPFVETNDDDFRDLLDVHFWGTLHMSRAALPHLGRSGAGRLVNITSIGARVPVPHLAAYCASKFAQAGLSGVMAEELRGSGVRVVTVYPGLMRTGSHLNAVFKGDLAAEFAWFSAAATLPGLSMGAERAARAILRGVARGRADVVVPFTTRQLARVAVLAPRLTLRALAAVNRLLPTGDRRRAALTRVRGADIGLAAPLRALAVLGERAADRNNERGARRLV